MILLLDGYNVIHAVPEFARQLDRSLEAARAALINFCKAYRARRGDLEQLYVVFDGADIDVGWPQADHGGITVVFTQRHEEADERILNVIRAKTGRCQFVVVSNDTHVFNNARVHGARAISVEEFYAQARRPRATRSTPQPVDDKPPLSTRDAQQITEEYRKHLERNTQGGASSRPARPRHPKR